MDKRGSFQDKGGGGAFCDQERRREAVPAMEADAAESGVRNTARHDDARARLRRRGELRHEASQGTPRRGERLLSAWRMSPAEVASGGRSRTKLFRPAHHR